MRDSRFLASMSAINRFLLENNLRIATNPCVSPDFCLDWLALKAELLARPEIAGLADGAWDSLRSFIERDATGPDSQIRR